MKIGMREMVVAGDVGAPECEVLARTRAFGGSESPPSASFFLALTDIQPSSSPGSGHDGLQGSEPSEANMERVSYQGDDSKTSFTVGGQTIPHYI